MSYKKPIDGVFSGHITLDRKIDVSRVNVTTDGVVMGLDVYIKLSADGDFVKLEITNGVSSIPVLVAHTVGWKKLFDGVELHADNVLAVDVKSDAFGGVSLNGVFMRSGGDIKFDLHLRPHYAPKLHAVGELKLNGWMPAPELNSWKVE